MKTEEAENIRVAVRCRPMNEREIREQAVSCFTSDNGNAVLTNLENPTEKYEFGYDFVYGCDTEQEKVFHDIGVPILDRAFGGYNGTIFAYGQTGSGKTFSMSGVAGSEVLEGLIPRMNKAIFERIKADRQANPHKLYLVECSFFEIYNEIIYDLLDASGNKKQSKGGLEIKEHSVLGIYVKDLQERVVESRDEVIDLMTQGAGARTVGYTQMNAESSRSHSIFVIKIHQKDATDESKNIFAKINLVDLAGSERAASTGAQGDRLKEGANINKSLSALGNVINALVEASRTGKKVFIPYRNSKLTRVLQESLGGNSLCSMLATLSPANINFAETLSTLKYASRAKSIKVNAKKNEASSQISQLNDEIAALKKKLMEQTSATLGLDPKEKEEIVKQYEKQIQEMDRVRLQTWEDKARLSKQHELERKRLAKEKALTDQKIRDERTRKWKLLEEKGDVELLMRALRDLDGPSGTSAIGLRLEEQWLERAQKMKALETDAKDHRTLILVFKDSLYKDAEQWAKRFQLDGKAGDGGGGTSCNRRDDSAAVHMTASQLCSKLQNIQQESTQLLQIENQLIVEGSTLANDIMSELLQFKEQRAMIKANHTNKPSTLAPTTGGNKMAVKEEEQLLEEREKGLSMTLMMVQAQRAKLVSSIKRERMKIFDFQVITTQFAAYIDQQTANLQSAEENGSSEKVAKIGMWRNAKAALLNVANTWRTACPSETAVEISTPLLPAVTYTSKGETRPLGIESKLVSDECLLMSSKKSGAKFVRMNSPHFWLPEEQDKSPALIIDFELPRFFDSIMIVGGMFNGSTTFPYTPSGGASISSLNGQVNPNRPRSPNDAVTTGTSLPPQSLFVLKSASELQAELHKYKLAEITGDYETTYAILSNVMSWVDLLKTAVVPAKLFARPPVRFLHDVISMAIHNTKFADDLFSPTEKDYTQLTSKTERADYLTKILDFVQEHYKQKKDRGECDYSVVIAATAFNILAGKEATDTLKFLSFFGLAAMEHAILHPLSTITPSSVISPSQTPVTTTGINQETITAVASPRSSEETSKQNPVDQNITKPTEPAVTNVEQQQSQLHSCYVKKLRVATSFNGKDWTALGDFEANSDATTINSIMLRSGAVGRFLRLTCMEWAELPLFQVEVFGREASESNELAKSMEMLGAKATDFLQQLLNTASLLLDEAKALWEKAKDVDREKQEEMTNLVAELSRLKQQNTGLEKQVKDLQHHQAQLQLHLDQETKKIQEEQDKSMKLTTETQQIVCQLEEMKKQRDAVEAKVSEQVHTITTITLQQSEQQKTIESLQQSKRDLEELCTNLRNQLQNKDQQEGHNESKIASIYGELMAANVQIDELKRQLETSEQMRKEQETLRESLHAQLQQQRSSMIEKETRLEQVMKQKQQDADQALLGIKMENERLRREVDRGIAAEKIHQTNNNDLVEQVKTLKDEIDEWKQKLKTAEAKSAALATPEYDSPANSNNRNAEEQQEKLLLEAQTRELRCLAEIDKMETKLHVCEENLKQAEQKLVKSEKEHQVLKQRIAELEDIEEELQLQLQVVIDERDSARQKEEQLFAENNEKEQEIERIRDGYVWVTDRMNSKEDELSELQEQLEKYQSLLEITTKKKNSLSADPSTINLMKVYTHVLGSQTSEEPGTAEEMLRKLAEWFERSSPHSSEALVANKANHKASVQLSNGLAAPSPSSDEQKKVKSTPSIERTGTRSRISADGTDVKDGEVDYDDDFDVDESDSRKKLAVNT